MLAKRRKTDKSTWVECVCLLHNEEIAIKKLKKEHVEKRKKKKEKTNDWALEKVDSQVSYFSSISFWPLVFFRTLRALVYVFPPSANENANRAFRGEVIGSGSYSLIIAHYPSVFPLHTLEFSHLFTRTLTLLWYILNHTRLFDIF